MADNRSPIDIIDTQRKESLVALLRPVAPLPEDHEWSGVQVVTARDILEVFEEDLELDYPDKATVTTPAHIWVDIVCPQCHQTIPDQHGELIASVTKDGEKPGKVRAKLKIEAAVHVCGQRSTRDVTPQPPEAKGQEPAFEDDDLLPGEGTDEEVSE